MLALPAADSSGPFDLINGVPVHPLVAAADLGPLGVLFGLVFGAVLVFLVALGLAEQFESMPSEVTG